MKRQIYTHMVTLCCNSCRYTRSVPTVCPLSETKHPLYAVGAINVHTISKQCMACMAAFIDGSSHVVLKGECPQRPLLFSVVNGDKFMDIYRLQLIVCADSKQHQSSFARMAKANAVMFATRHVGSAEVASNRTTQFSVHGWSRRAVQGHCACGVHG